VQKIASPPAGQPAVRLVDGDGQQVVEVAEFLRLLVVRDYSPNTIRAYAHDLQKLYQFLQLQGLTVEQFTPGAGRVVRGVAAHSILAAQGAAAGLGVDG
jgi:integrase/recombinase XerD